MSSMLLFSKIILYLGFCVKGCNNSIQTFILNILVFETSQVFSLPDGKLKKYQLTRFTLPVRALAYSSSGKFLAAASDDAEIRLIDIETEAVSPSPMHWPPGSTIEF